MEAVANDFNVLGLSRNLSETIIEQELEFAEFYNNFYGKGTHAVDDLFDYREHKLSKNIVSYDEFEKLINTKGISDTFTKVFLQYFSETDISVIRMVIDENKLNLQQIYNKFYENKDVNVMRHVIELL